LATSSQHRRQRPAAPTRSRQAPAAPSAQSGGKDRNLVGALARGINILTAFTAHEAWLGNTEIARRVGLAKSTVSRITRTLTALGYLRYSPRLRQYRLGVPVLALGYSVLADIDVRKVARPRMQAFANAHNGLIGLAVRDGFDLIHIETCHSATSVVSLRLDAGTRTPIADTAFGWALLSALPADERDLLLAQLEHQYGGRWPAVRQALVQSFDAIGRDGFCLAHSAWQPDISALAVPLLLPGGEPPLSIGMAGFAGKLTRARLKDEIGPGLVELARSIEADLQGLP
jgi:DNA-binding IclR family transcriptional regulator